MLDTNVLVSHLVLPSPAIGRVVADVATRQELVLSTFVIDELRVVVARKWPDRSGAVERLLGRASFEVVATPEVTGPRLFEIATPSTTRCCARPSSAASTCW